MKAAFKDCNQSIEMHLLGAVTMKANLYELALVHQGSFTMILNKHPAFLDRVNFLRLCKISQPLVALEQQMASDSVNSVYHELAWNSLASMFSVSDKG